MVFFFLFEDVSDAINRVVAAVRRRKDDAAMDEIEGMCCADPKQFWCRYMPGVSQRLRLAALSSRAASCSAAASAAVGAGAWRTVTCTRATAWRVRPLTPGTK